MRHVRVALAALLLFLGATLVTLFPSATLVAWQQTRPSSSGVYTAAQAALGEKVYFAQCASCHGDDLGGRERAPALGGGPFVDAWSGKDLRQLIDRIDAMPPSAPKSLAPTDAGAVLAFLLRDAQMPSGATPLPTDRAELARITFQRAPAAVAAAPVTAPRGGVPPAPFPRQAPKAAGKADDRVHRLPRVPASGGPRMVRTSRVTAIQRQTRSRKTTSIDSVSPGGSRPISSDRGPTPSIRPPRWSSIAPCTRPRA